MLEVTVKNNSSINMIQLIFWKTPTAIFHVQDITPSLALTVQYSFTSLTVA